MMLCNNDGLKAEPQTEQMWFYGYFAHGVTIEASNLVYHPGSYQHRSLVFKPRSFFFRPSVVTLNPRQTDSVASLFLRKS